MDDQEIVDDELVEIEEETTEDETEVIDWEARAKKAEALIVKHKKEPVAEKPTQATPQLNVEETVLLANGLEEELLVQLKKIATINGTSLIKAQNDPIFVAVKEKFEQDKKRENASLPASRGAGQVKAKKDFSTEGLSREEHMAMLKKRLS
jgi:hypothetical protein